MKVKGEGALYHRKRVTPSGMAKDTTTLLMEGAQRLRDTLGAKFSAAKLLGVLSDYPCPSRCADELTHSHHRNIDRYYSVRHSFLQRLLLDELRLRLRREGFNVRIAAENDLTFGHGDLDVVLLDGNGGVSFNGLAVRTELKGGHTFGFPQLIRYLMDVDVVVVTLAGRGKAFAVRKRDVKDLVEFTMGLYARKLETLIQDRKERIPGPWCRGCMVECPHSLPESAHTVNFDLEFVAQSSNWVSAVEDTCEKIVGLLVEVRNSKPDAIPRVLSSTQSPYDEPEVTQRLPP